jgi:hypothetical protein
MGFKESWLLSKGDFVTRLGHDFFVLALITLRYMVSPRQHGAKEGPLSYGCICSRRTRESSWIVSDCCIITCGKRSGIWCEDVATGNGVPFPLLLSNLLLYARLLDRISHRS